MHLLRLPRDDEQSMNELICLRQAIKQSTYFMLNLMLRLNIYTFDAL